MDYAKFDVTDFITDDGFIRWVNQPDEATNQFWAGFLAANPQQTATVQQARRLVQHLERTQHDPTDAGDEPVRRMWKQIERKTATDGPVRQWPLWRSYGWYAAAASVVLVLGTFGWFNQRSATPTAAHLPAVMRVTADTLQVAGAFKTVKGPLSVSLTDGSRVQLSANSSLRFPAQFDAQRREVYLIGEAFFDVTRRPEHPFLVHTDDLVTRVLGTRFRVKAYPDKGQVSVDVRTGKVAVFVRNSEQDNRMTNQSVTLTPNQQAVYELTGERLSKAISENPLPLEGEPVLAFDEAPIQAVFAAVERLYGIPIQYDRDRLANCTLTTSIDALPLFDQLNLVCKAINATYQQRDGRIVVNGGGCD